MDLTFYNKNGDAISYSEDHVHIYSFEGQAVGYITDDSIYDYDGNHLGWFKNGWFSASWVRDQNGNCIFFTHRSKNGPLKPLKNLEPLKSLKDLEPLKPVNEHRPIKPVYSFNWADEVSVISLILIFLLNFNYMFFEVFGFLI